MKRNLNHQNLIIHRNQRKTFDELLVDETIFSQANGVLGTRGHFMEGYGLYDYPQTYINGFYNLYPLHYEENYQQFPQVGQTIVNLPDASQIKIESEDGIINLHEMQLTDLKRCYDMSNGTTTRVATYISKKGFEFVIKEEKMVPTDTMIVLSKLTLSSRNYFGKIQLTSTLTMPKPRRPRNLDPRLPHAIKHLDLIDLHTHHNLGYLTAITTQSLLKIRVAITHNLPFDYRVEFNDVIGSYQTTITPNQAIEIEKYQIFDTSLTTQDFDQHLENTIKSLLSFDEYVKKETQIKQTFWEKAYVNLDDPILSESLRYNIYQLNQSGGISEYASIAAKGISGDGYEGHYFWDTEAYMLPFFIMTQPEKAEKLLKYRYHMLDQAKKEAMNLGISRGAKIPWRTINGNESSPYYPAGSAQIHINSDLAFSIIMYYYSTNNDAFMKEFGLEILLETAIFILDWGHFKDNQFHLFGVTGPDEYTAIVNDNYHTNKMAQTHLSFTYQYVFKNLDGLSPLLDKLKITKEDLLVMKKASEQMTLLVDNQSNIIKQDASFMDKKDWDIASIPKHHFPLLLNFHPLHIYKHQILKQADALVAMVLHDDIEFEQFKNTLIYYLKRTTHDSSLSKCMYGIALYRIGAHELAYEYFKSVATLDLLDQKKYTTYGLHAANLGGSYLMMVYGLFGIRVKDMLTMNPVYQSEIKHAEFKMTYQDHHLHFQLEEDQIHLSTDRPIELLVYGQKISVDKHLTFGVKKIDHTDFLN